MRGRNPRHLAVHIVNRVFRSDSYADILLDEMLKRGDLSRQDSAFLAELVYGTLRWLARLDWILKQVYHGDWPRVPSMIRRTLEVGLYQILFLDKVPHYAVVNETVQIATEEKGIAWGRTVNAILREIVRHQDSFSPPSVESDPVLAISIRWSHPEWLVKKWVDELGVDRTLSLCEANNERPTLGVRVHPDHANRERVLKAFKALGIEAHPSALLDEFFTIEKAKGLVFSEPFKRGFFTIQDVSAGLVSHLVDPQPGERILDLCAAPGGKATHTAELGKDRVVVLAVDHRFARLQQLVENRDRLKLKHLYPVLADGRFFRVRPVDKVLVDAPCSGTGVLRRRGEMRWRNTERSIPELVLLQKRLLESGAESIQKGGILVYSTCSVLKEENEGVVVPFLENHSDFKVEDARLFVPSDVVSDRGFIETWPDRHGCDGSFAVRLKKVK